MGSLFVGRGAGATGGRNIARKGDATVVHPARGFCGMLHTMNRRTFIAASAVAGVHMTNALGTQPGIPSVPSIPQPPKVPLPEIPKVPQPPAISFTDLQGVVGFPDYWAGEAKYQAKE